MVKISTRIICVLFFSVFQLEVVLADDVFNSNLAKSMYCFQQDTTKKAKSIDTIGNMIKTLTKYDKLKDTVHLNLVKNVPNLSLQQTLKGNVTGVYVQESSGEPGTPQSMIIRGPSGIMFNKRDFVALQPVVYLNGVPLAQDNAFAYDAQQYDYNRIGPANNLLAQLNIDDIQSISIIKNPIELAKLGPNAANGAIYITSRLAKSGKRHISLNSYFGYVTAPGAYTTNGTYENEFRAPFYQQFGTAENRANYPSFLSDLTNNDYFGPSNWNDLYYQNAPSYHVNLGISGGTERANFRFFSALTKDAGNADETNFNKYNLSVAVNMAPFKWFTVSTKINAARLDRDRNRSLRDRFAEARYIPDLQVPLSPNADNYSNYLSELDKSEDLNRSTILNGSLVLAAKLNRLKLTSSFIFDYSEGIRDYFMPSTLMAGSSFVSTYFGYNQRLMVDNAASYDFSLNNKDHEITAQIGQQFQADTYKYNYTRGYNGPNDFIKIIEVLGDSKKPGYLNAHPNFYVFRFLDKLESNIFSVYASANYKYKNLFDFDAIIRRDGSSNGQPDSRWLTTPAFNATWHLGNQLLNENKAIQNFDVSAGWGRTINIFTDDRFAGGPQFRAEGGWASEPTLSGYASIITANRPYTSGYVGYGIPLAYADRTEITISSDILYGRLNLALTAYNRDNKNGVVNTPVPQEIGYTNAYKSGLTINNKGLELLAHAKLVKSEKGLSWFSGLNLSYNKNKVTALPDGLNELVYQDNKLQIGKSVGSYWLYTNTGIYETEAQIPVNPLTAQKSTFKGIPLQVGDPIWVDYNNDYRIDNNDKVITGDRLPKLIGGWNNNLTYKRFDLNFNVVFALGQKAINQFDALRYDFINRESANDITATREISSWQAFDGVKNYPIFNPFSAVVPYRQDQNLFLENASYLKLRSVTLGYDFSKVLVKAGIKRAYLYATAMNLFTITDFSGMDPELVNFNGIYDGANITIPRTFVLGFKLDL